MRQRAWEHRRVLGLQLVPRMLVTVVVAAAVRLEHTSHAEAVEA